MTKGWVNEILRKAVQKFVNYYITYKEPEWILQSKMLIGSSKKLRQSYWKMC